MRFLLVDTLLSLEIGRQIVAVKTIAPDEDYFQDHFPGYPVVPGVLLLEAIAQAGGRLVDATIRERSGAEVLPVLGMIKEARFQHPVRPGDRVELTADLVALNQSAARVTGAARVNDRVAASAEITYVLLKLDEQIAGLAAADVERLRAWSRDVWEDLRRPEPTVPPE